MVALRYTVWVDFSEAETWLKYRRKWGGETIECARESVKEMTGLCWTWSYLRPLQSIWWLLLNLSSHKPSKLALPCSKWDIVLRMEWTSTNKDGWDLSKGLRTSCPFFFVSKLYAVEYFVVCLSFLSSAVSRRSCLPPSPVLWPLPDLTHIISPGPSSSSVFS